MDFPMNIDMLDLANLVGKVMDVIMVFLDPIGSLVSTLLVS